jgi:hypothetical protein
VAVTSVSELLAVLAPVSGEQCGGAKALRR